MQLLLQIYITDICLREGEDVFLLSENTMEVLLLCFFNVGIAGNSRKTTFEELLLGKLLGYY